MKQVGNLWDRLVSFPNLLRAARKGGECHVDHSPGLCPSQP